MSVKIWSFSYEMGWDPGLFIQVYLCDRPAYAYAFINLICGS